MIDKVFVLSRILVRNLTLGVNIFKYVPGFDSRPFILISCFGNKYYHIDENPKLEPTPRPLVRNESDLLELQKFGMIEHLNVFCDDITQSQYDKLIESKEYYVKLFDEQNAIDIKNFIDKHITEDIQLLVHCDAGISRSGAVATSICEHYGITKEFIHDNIHPNSTILSICKDTWNLQN